MRSIDKILLYTLTSLFVCFSLRAQFPNPANFNTATNATNTGTLAMGSNDLHWSAALTNSLGIYVPAVVCGNQATCCWINSPYPNATWITYPHTCSASPAEHSCLGNVDEFYKLTFNLPSTNCAQAITTPSAYCLSLDFFADNWVSDINVNGIVSFVNPNGSPYGAAGFSSGLTVSLCNNWQAGTNTVIVHVKSGAPSFPGWTGFLAQANQTVNVSVGVPFSGTVNATNVSCNGLANGSATMALSGSGPFTYTWLPSGGNSSIANNLTAGSYTVTGSNGVCSLTKTLSITQPAGSTLSTSPNTVICNGAAATLSVSGATSYTWSSGSNSNTISISAPGIYTVTGSNGGACAGSATISVTGLAGPTLAVGGSSVVCAGSVVLTASGASSYTWSNGSLSASTTVSSAGTYSVAGNNGSGCISTQTIAISASVPPTVSINGISSLCSGQNGTLTASGANSYTWNTGSLTPTITVNSPGTYSVIGSNAAGCTSTQTIGISAMAGPTLTINGTNTICAGQSASLTASGAISYTWNTGANTAVLNIIPVTNTTYSVTGANNAGCIQTQTFNVAVNPPPILSITGNTIICTGSSSTLNVSGADSYSWNTGATANYISVNPTVTTFYSVTGTNTLTGCSASVTGVVNVSNIPTVNVTGGNVCRGESIILQAQGGTSYSWNTGATTNTLQVSPQSNVIYTVTAYGTFSLCSSSQTTGVNVLAAPQISVNASVITICKGSTALLSASGANTYFWSSGQASQTIFVNPDYSTTYTVSALETLTGCRSVKTVQVNVNEAPDVNISGNTDLCDGERMVLQGSGATSYIWQTGATTSSIEITVSENTLYTLFGMNDETGCGGMDTIRVGASEKCCDIYIPNSFTPNNDAINEEFGPVSLCEFKEYKMYIFDKWGEQIFVSESISKKWNGYYRGVLSQQDIYVYLIRATRKGAGVRHYIEKTGHVSLIR